MASIRIEGCDRSGIPPIVSESHDCLSRQDIAERKPKRLEYKWDEVFVCRNTQCIFYEPESFETTNVIPNSEVPFIKIPKSTV